MGRRWWLWPALVVTATLAPFWRVIAGAVTLVSRDTFELYEPMRALIVPALRAGRLPLWNPYEAAGVPLFAQALHGVLHPVSIVTALPPFEGLDAAVVLYVVAAAMGAYALARTLGATPAASACAAFGYGLGGYTVSMAANIVFLAGAASAPWTLAAMRRCAAPGSAPRHVVGVAVAVAVTAFSGEFESLAWSLALGSVLAADAGGRRGLARSVVGAGLGILVAGVQLVPSWVFLQRTTRGDALDVAERLQWPLEPWRLVEWIAPGFFWNVDASPFLLLGGETQHAVPFAESVFIGGAVLVLALGGVGRSRTARLLVMFAGLCLWQALGYRLGAAQLTSFVPIWGEFRYAEKLMAPITLCAAVLCALGADRVTTAGPPRWLERAAMGLLVAVAMAGVVSWLAPGAVRAFFLAAGRGQGPTPPPPEFVAAAASSRDHLARGVLRAVPFLAALVLLLRTVRVHRAAWALPALAWVVFLESAAAAPLALHLMPHLEPGDRTPPAVVGTSTVPRIEVPYPNEEESIPHVPGVSDPRITLGRLGISSLNVAAGIDNISDYSGLIPRRWSNLYWALGEDRWRAYRRFSVTHAVVPPLAPDEASFLRLVTEGGRVVARDPKLRATVWAVPHRPWALFAEAARTYPGPYEVHDRLLAAIAADDPTVLVETTGPVATGPGFIRSVERGAEHLRIEAGAPSDSLLVVNDAFFPGWRAWIDGREVEVLAADILVRAVRWPAGVHVLEMAYDPPEVRWGIWTTLAGLVLLAGLVGVEWSLRRSARTSLLA